MCGRFRLAGPQDALTQLFDLDSPPSAEARYNIAPGQRVLAVRASAAGTQEHFSPRWGLVPFWSKEAPPAARMINARAETAAVKPSFRIPFRQRRCLIPADGFYEWSARGGARKTPWLITLADDAPFAFAGLWDRCGTPSGDLETVTILTTAPNELLAPIHDRMPVLLDPEDFPLWLDPGVSDPSRVQPLLRSRPADDMTAVPVGPYVNNPRNEGPECSAPAAPERPSS